MTMATDERPSSLCREQLRPKCLLTITILLWLPSALTPSFVGVRRTSRSSLVSAHASLSSGQPDPADKAMRYEHDNSAKWDPQNRMKTKSPEEAERILKITGRLPRPLRLSAVKLGAAPLRKTIVASAKERRAAAEMAGIYSVSRLQARLLLHREVHPVWGYEREMIYSSMISE